MSKSQLTWDDRCDLAQRFAPRLVLFPEDERLGRPGKRTDFELSGDYHTIPGRSKDTGDYYPRGIGPLCERARIISGFISPRTAATLDNLAACTRKTDQLSILGRWFPNPDTAWRTYFKILGSTDHTGKTGLERFPVTAYAHVLTRAEATAASSHKTNLGNARLPGDDEIGRPFFRLGAVRDDDLVIQYWFCYYFDDWANYHEGDWEGISIFLSKKNKVYKPMGAGYYAHESGNRRHWAEIERTSAKGDHPLVYVAAGSHASYFQYSESGYIVRVPGRILSSLRVRLWLRFLLTSTVRDQVPDSQQYRPITPRVELLSDPIGPTDPDDPAQQNIKWLSFPGAWGIDLVKLAYGGPFGPSHKGLKWHNPFAWVERHCLPDYFVY